MNIRAILFDAVGTLFHSRGTIGEIYGSVAALYDLQTDPRAIDSEFLRLIQSRGTPIGKQEWKTLVRSVFAPLGPFPRFEDFFEEVYEVFQTKKGWLCYPETIPVLRTLAESGYRLGVISNFDSRLDGVLRDLELAHFFAAVVTPPTSGYAKPDTRIFLEAVGTLGVEPEQAIFAGDDPVADFRAANRAGLWGVLVDRERGEQASEPNHIRDLRGLFKLLEIPPDGPRNMK